MNTHHSFGLFVTFRLKFELVAPMLVVSNHGTFFTNCIASLFLFSVWQTLCNYLPVDFTFVKYNCKGSGYQRIKLVDLNKQD